MKNKFIRIGIILSMTILNLFLSSCQDEPEKWTHKTFQGTVIDIQTEEEQQYFSIRCNIGEDEYNIYSFVISEETLYRIPFEIGDKILVETDYNMNEHNGTTVPYPAVLIADPEISD